MINFSKIFVNSPVFIVAFSLAMFIAGIFSFINLNRNEDPGFKIRTASIITPALNYSAKEVDKGVTRPIEEAISVIEEIEEVKSESYQGKSVIYADLFENYSIIQPIFDRLRRKVEGVKPCIYEGLSPIVNDEFGDVFGALVGISKQGAPYEELYDLAKVVKNEFLKMPEHGRVEIFGTREEALYLNFKTSYLTNLKIMPDELQRFVNSINRVKTGGIIYGKRDNAEIISDDFFNSPESVARKFLDVDGVALPFKSIFDVKKTVRQPVSKLVRSNGKNALIIGISLKKDGNILKWGKEIKKTVERLQNIHNDANFEILSLQSDYVKYLSDKFTSSLLESIFAVIAVIFFILGLRAGVITGVIIVMTVVSTFFVMKILNIGLDKISLSALIISLGILVDNSIVIAESALNKGFLPYDELKKHLVEVVNKFQTPLLAVTLTASLAFFPVFIANSTVGEYASNLFKVVSIVLLFSWLYSISLLPYLLLKFHAVTGFQQKQIFISNFLKNKIQTSLDYPKSSVMIAFLAFLVSLFLFSFVPKIFFPPSDRNAFEIRLNLKNGVSFDVTNYACSQVEKFLDKFDDILSYSSYIGTSAPRYVLSASPEADKLNFAMILAGTKSYKTVDDDILRVKDFINKNVKNVQAVVRKIPLGPPVDAPVEVRIINDDINKLFYYKKNVSDILAKNGGIYLVKDNWGDFTQEYRIKINEQNAIATGISPDYLFDWLNTVYNGKILTHYFRGEVKIPVILRAEDDFLKNLTSLNSVSIFSKKKNSIVPITQIASIKALYGYPKILRRNYSYVLTVQAWTKPNVTADKIVREITPKLNEIKGLNYQFGGEVEKSRKGMKSVAEKIPVAFLIVFLILIALFDDVKKPLIVFVCAVFALTGAIFGLFITHLDFGFMTFLGCISLVGICVNNGVVLMNEIKSDNYEGILSAAKSRVEPVLLTSLTTIGGMLPLWIKNDPMFSTLAVAMIFGLFSSVVITLFVLPSAYLLLINSLKNLK